MQARLSKKEVLRKVGLCATTWLKEIKNGTAPAPCDQRIVNGVPTKNFWLEQDIEEYLSGRRSWGITELRDSQISRSESSAHPLDIRMKIEQIEKILLELKTIL